MLDPSLPWLATGYRNFKEKEFCRPHSATDSAHHRYLENGSNHRELRPTTPAQHQHRRVKSATYGRVHGGAPTIKHRLSSRPRSARSTENFKNEKVGCYNFSPETIQALARRPKSASAVLLRHHRPSAAQNKSVTQVERFHHTQQQIIRQYEKVTGEEVQHSCAFCPVTCRPTSSSSNRPTSSTGLLAAHLPSHHDRRYNWTRPKTAPTTKREVSSLPRHNNVRRGRVPYYTNFVSQIPLHLRDRTPSPPPSRRRRAFQEESPSQPVVGDEEEEVLEEVEDDFLEEDINIEEDDIAEPVEEAPSPPPPPAKVEVEPKLEPPSEAMEAWSPEIPAPTPTPSGSRRNSELEPPVIEKPPSPIPSPPPSPIPPLPQEKPSPPPPTKSPTPPPPKSPSPPPKSPTPPPPTVELSIKPPRECVHKPKPPVPPLPKVKKEVRIEEPPKDPPKEKIVVKKEKKPIQIVSKSPPVELPAPVPLKPSLKKSPSEPKIEVTPPVKMEPPPLPTLEPEPAVEPPAKPSPKEDTKVEEEKVPEKTDDGSPNTEDVAEKKKLGPPPTKVKVDMFGMDPQSIKQLLDLQMRAKRKGGNLDDENEQPRPDLASLLEPTNRMLKQSDWLRGRIALSRRAARFELPMDVGDLAEMSPVDYLRRHCIISQRRRALYKKAFVKVDKDNDGKINRKELEKAVLDALVDTIQPDKVEVALGYLGAEGDAVFNSRFFSTFCALLERLYYREFTKDDVVEKTDTKEKEILEEADFSGLDWKLHGQYVNPPLKALLYML
ncbi:serine/arginine repetitive matrix protein 1-like isoform X1 [Lytechinus variegatus]|uniref:serine/arginine repetitive matrix protein 1-like isoform X1 n=1 Tax=Lytechinus variegatus TaxID=7654 RepID=UPI001BB149F3|nr:serine/arginine repetitive matrix protein 1-like isoform X1 [Lytechinus variegatus]